MIAASVLQKEDYERIKVVLGGLSGWSSTTCPIT
jgi:rhodanese-related sulfurtransferase